MSRVDSPLGEILCLEFTNTVASHDGQSEYDWIETFPDLVQWLREQRVIDQRQASAYLQAGREHPAVARRVLALAHELRSSLYAIFSSVPDATRPPAKAVRVLNDALADAMAGATLHRQDDAFEMKWPSPTDDPRTALFPIVRSASHVLTSDELERVRYCSGKTCRWLFIDRTNNRSRRYCSTTGCGNRARVQRFYEAQR